MAYADGTTVSAAAADGDANNGSTSAPDLVQLLPNATLTEQQLVALVAPSAAEQLHIKNTATMLWFHCVGPVVEQWIIAKGESYDVLPSLTTSPTPVQFTVYLMGLQSALRQYIAHVASLLEASVSNSDRNKYSAFLALYSKYYMPYLVQQLDLLVRANCDGISVADQVAKDIARDAELRVQHELEGAAAAADGAARAARDATAFALALPSSAKHGKQSIKVNAPDNFSSKDNPKAWLLTWEAWYGVVHNNAESSMKSKVLMLSLDKTVLDNLRNMFLEEPNFWDSADDISKALLSVYAKPNEQAEARNKLMSAKMIGLRLSAYYRNYCKNAALAGVRLTEPHWKEMFFQGLNADAMANGSFKVSIIGTYNDPSATVFDIYKAADEVLRVQHGASYETQKLTHNAPTLSKGDDRSRATATKKRKRERDDESSPDDGNKSTGKQRKKHKACTRCGNEWHLAEHCSAKFAWKNNKRTSTQLPITTAAKYKAGDPDWIGGNYPSFSGGTSKDGDAKKRTSKTKADVGSVQVLLDPSGRQGNFTVQELVSANLIHANVQTKKKRACRQERILADDNSGARLTLQTITSDSVVTKPMCAAVTRKRTDDDGDVVMEDPWLIAQSDAQPGASASTDGKKGFTIPKRPGYKPEGNRKRYRR